MTFEEAFLAKLRRAEDGQGDRPHPHSSCSEELRLRSQAYLARWHALPALRRHLSVLFRRLALRLTLWAVAAERHS